MILDILTSPQEDLRVVIDTIPALVWSALPDGHIDYLNRQWLEYTGLSLKEASGWGWQQAIHPEDLAGLVAYWQSILTAGVAGEHEARLRRHDGVYRWFLFRGVPLHHASGALIKWYGTNTDVEELRYSKHLARGQTEALTQTLAALARESNPDCLLEHVLRTIGERLGAHSIGVWEMNPATGRVELVGNCEDGRLEMNPAPEGASIMQPPAGSESHPVWTEFFSHGWHCVAGKFENGGAQVRTLDGTNTPWYDWRSQVVADQKVPLLMERLKSKGVKSTLSVPMFVAGAVKGFLSIRFSKEPDFHCDEIELATALANQAMLAMQIMRLSQESRRLAVVAERNRMARELHDTLSQGITGVLVQLEAAEDASARQLPEAVQQHLKRARELARESLREARRSVHGMRSQALEQQSLCDALVRLFKSMTEGSPLHARFELRGTPWEMRPRWEDNLLRMVQEVLTNTLRHAQATNFHARLSYTPERLRLQLHDNGRGFNTAEGHDGFGLIGIRERVETMGGRIHIRSKARRGTSIGICIPMEKSESEMQS
ncbi:PAS domain S-box-containing protein [Roseimicrobium gellanilyticum]|uniref:PAS domain S-box-containing protein n=1 Tax=Roseimicrobium gellanilyticum TaxID=748857 RepID=A0A366HKM0_9BACT|nr:histidine kinase [Roseimicrobium gellanilyticum]RBP42313.1 PAS domain S-box-containing protein [Roseimicrobium gellanilyticum]